MREPPTRCHRGFQHHIHVSILRVWHALGPNRKNIMFALLGFLFLLEIVSIPFLPAPPTAPLNVFFNTFRAPTPAAPQSHEAWPRPNRHLTLPPPADAGYTSDPTIATSFWPDEVFYDTAPTLEDAKKLGLVENHNLPYPTGNTDTPHIRETIYETPEFFDNELFLTREELGHAPIVSSVAFENFADLRLTALTKSTLHLGIEERVALREFWEANGQLKQALEFDHEQQKHLFTNEYLSQRNVSHASPSTASAPQHSREQPYTELLPRLIQGDAVHDTMGMHFLHSDFPFERGMPMSFRDHFCDRFVELLHLPDRPPLVVNVQKLHHFHFVVRCVYLRANALATAKRQFVLLGTEIDETPSAAFFFATGEIDPSEYKEVTLPYIMNHPLLAHWYGTNGVIRHPKFTALPIGMQFYHRSTRLQEVTVNFQGPQEHQHSVFTSIFLSYLNLTHMLPHLNTHRLQFGALTTMFLERTLEVLVGSTVKPPVRIIPLDQLPERITTFYVVLMPIERYKRADRPSLTDDVIIFEEPSEANHHRTASVQHIALLPFTVALYQTLLQNPYGSPERHAPEGVITAFRVEEWRWKWFNWVKDHQLSIEAPHYTPLFFYSLARDHVYVLSPPGKGYECYRAWESLSLGAIPILQNPAALAGDYHVVGSQGELAQAPLVEPFALLEPYRDLPVIFVDRPEDITKENLSKWRKEIYHRALKGDYKLEKLFTQYWVDKIYGHRNSE